MLLKTPFPLFTHLNSPVELESSTLLSVRRGVSCVVPLGQNWEVSRVMLYACVVGHIYLAEAPWHMSPLACMCVCVCGVWCVHVKGVYTLHRLLSHKNEH